MSPPIQLFLTTIASQPALRKRQEYLLRILQAKKIPYTSYDLASDEKAKSLWRRKAPPDKQQLPGILVGGSFPGSFSEFEEAVEYGELDTFLRLKETWHDAEDDPPILPEKPIGVPGAATPLQMTPEHMRTKILAGNASADASPSRSRLVPINKQRDPEIDLGDELSGYGLQGVKVSENELLNIKDLVAELGLDGDDAGDLIKGLGGDLSLDEPVKVQEEPSDRPASPATEQVPTSPSEKTGTSQDENPSASETEESKEHLREMSNDSLSKTPPAEETPALETKALSAQGIVEPTETETSKKTVDAQEKIAADPASEERRDITDEANVDDSDPKLAHSRGDGVGESLENNSKTT